ncbi:unnamed protein product [Peniophora sp. CBMAI 1063]|nr:unnamed protein product [Peniophora sp. CBMAI 1063]
MSNRFCSYARLTPSSTSPALAHPARTNTPARRPLPRAGEDHQQPSTCWRAADPIPPLIAPIQLTLYPHLGGKRTTADRHPAYPRYHQHPEVNPQAQNTSRPNLPTLRPNSDPTRTWSFLYRPYLSRRGPAPPLDVPFLRALGNTAIPTTYMHYLDLLRRSRKCTFSHPLR